MKAFIVLLALFGCSCAQYITRGIGANQYGNAGLVGQPLQARSNLIGQSGIIGQRGYSGNLYGQPGLIGHQGFSGNLIGHHGYSGNLIGQPGIIGQHGYSGNLGAQVRYVQPGVSGGFVGHSGISQIPQVQYNAPAFRQYSAAPIRQFQTPVQYSSNIAPAQSYQAPIQYSASPALRTSAVRTPAILRQSQDVSHDGTYNFGFESEDGIAVQTSGAVKALGPEDSAHVAQGSYSYTAPDGTPITTNWYADETGFHAEGAHLPQGPTGHTRTY